MKQTLPDYIKQNEDLCKILLAQDGGIMKYWAEHPDADFDVDLFEGYENEIVNSYLQANKQNRAVRSVPKDELRRRSLDWYQSKESELKFFVDMKPALTAFDMKVPEEVLNYIEIYMADAYKESHRSKYPEGMSPRDFYNKVLEVFGPFGLALDCLERVLQEYRGKAVRITVKHFFQTVIVHHGGSPEWEEVNNLQTEFDMRMFKEIYHAEGGYKKLRQAVKELIDNSTKKLTEEESRKVCREIAKDDMMKVNQFTRWINNETYPMEEAKGGKLVPLITPEERRWVLNIMYENFPGATGTQKLTPMGRLISIFIYLLQEIGEIWAAQLLVHGINMKELEKETGIILSKSPCQMYYVDRMPDDRRGDCCIYDWPEAKELLSKLKSYGEGNDGVDIKEVSDSMDMVEEEETFDEDEYEEDIDEEDGVYDDDEEDVNIQDWNLFKDWILKDKVIEAIEDIPLENVVGDVKRHFVIHKVLKEIGWLRHNQSTRYVGLMKYHDVVDFKAKSFQDDDLKPFKKNPTKKWGNHLTPGSNLGENYRLFAETVRNTFTRIINGELDDLKEFYVPGKKKYNQVIADNG